MDNGLDLTGTTAPVNVRRSAVTGMVSGPLLHGTGMYIDAAGRGFDQVHATPQGPQARSAIVPPAQDAQMTELYSMGPQYVRQRLNQQFGLRMPARPGAPS